MIGDNKPKRTPKTVQKSDRSIADEKKATKPTKAPFTARPFKRVKTGGGR